LQGLVDKDGFDAYVRKRASAEFRQSSRVTRDNMMGTTAPKAFGTGHGKSQYLAPTK